MRLLTDIAIPDGSDVNTKETETKQFNYLEIKVSRMWKVRTKIVPVIIGALKKIRKGLDQNLQLLPDHLSAIELQKITLMSTAYIIHKVLG
jgi:ABC-type sulfate transport system permease subunit